MQVKSSDNFYSNDTKRDVLVTYQIECDANERSLVHRLESLAAGWRRVMQLGAAVHWRGLHEAVGFAGGVVSDPQHAAIKNARGEAVSNSVQGRPVARPARGVPQGLGQHAQRA